MTASRLQMRKEESRRPGFKSRPEHHFAFETASWLSIYSPLVSICGHACIGYWMSNICFAIYRISNIKHACLSFLGVDFHHNRHYFAVMLFLTLYCHSFSVFTYPHDFARVPMFWMKLLARWNLQLVSNLNFCYQRFPRKHVKVGFKTEPLNYGSSFFLIRQYNYQTLHACYPLTFARFLEA